MGPWLTLLVLLFTSSNASGTDQPLEEGLDTGIRQVRDGDFEGGILTLDLVIRRLGTASDRAKELSQAYLFIGVAYAGLRQDGLAKAKFQLALTYDPALRLDPSEFPRRVVSMFEVARQTRATEQAAARQAQRSAPKAGLILLGLGGVAAGAIATIALPRDENHPPVGDIVVAPTGQAIAGVTTLTFTGISSDPDGDNIAMSWDFGDGHRAAGQTASHVYESPGSYSVTLGLSDGKADGTVTLPLTARLLTGTWDSDGTYQLVQSGNQVTGVHVLDGKKFSVAGTVTDPRLVTLKHEAFTPGGTSRPCSQSVKGSANSALSQIFGLRVSSCATFRVSGNIVLFRR